MYRKLINVEPDGREKEFGWSDETSFYEGFLSLKPSDSYHLDIGKRTLKWGKG